MNPINPINSTTETGFTEFRVFISSTFRDMHAEREQLVKHVFPELRRVCRERGLEFTEVDLRWGITEQQALQGEVVRICLDEISRHRPYIIGIIGDRYGWKPALEDLGNDDQLLDRYPWLRQAVEDRRSLVELEVMQGLLSDPLMSAHAFFYFRAEADNGPEENPEEAAEERRRLAELKERIRISGVQVREGFADIDALGEWVRRDLLAVIDRDHPTRRHASWLEGERQGHESFAASRRRAYVEHPEMLTRLDEFCSYGFQPEHDPGRDAGATTLVITGESGAGKSALLAHWSERYRERHPDAFIIEHYIGATSASGDHRELLRRIMAEIKERYGINDELPSSGERIEEEFSLWLAYVRAESDDFRLPIADFRLEEDAVPIDHTSIENPKSKIQNSHPSSLVLVLDALNQLDEGSQSLAWLPEYIPPGVRLVVSTLEGRPLDVLRARGCQELLVEPLTRSDRTEIIRRYLGNYRKELSADQLNRIASDNTAANPLFLRTSLEELRVFGSFEQLDEKIDYYLGAHGLDELFQRVLARIEGDYSEGLVRDVMTRVWASRWGLSESELLGMIGCTRLDLSRLLLALEYHLTSRNGLLTFFHDHLRLAVEQRYLPELSDQKQAHLRVAKYFEQVVGGQSSIVSGKELESDIPSLIPPSFALIPARVATELPWQLVQAEAWEQLKECIADIPMFSALYNEEKKYELSAYWLALGERWDVVDEYRKNLTRYQEKYQPDELELAALLNLLAEFFNDSACYNEAEEMARHALELREKLLSAEHVDIAATLNLLGMILNAKGDYDGAEEVLGRALDLYEKISGPESRETAEVLDSLGELMYARREYDRAELFERRALEIYEMIVGAEHPEIAERLSMLGAVLYARAEFVGAEALYRKALLIFERGVGMDHPQRASALNNIGTVLMADGDLVGAIDLVSQALAIHEKVLGPEHPTTASTLINLAVAHKRKGDYDAAEQLYRRALIIEKRKLGPEHPMVAQNLINLATLIRAKGDLVAAEPLLREAVAIRQKNFGPDHLETAASLLNMAGFMKEKGEYGTAELLYRQAVPIWVENKHPETAAAVKGFVDLLRKMGNDSEAAAIEQKLLADLAAEG